jgi:hypothetical protein
LAVPCLALAQALFLHFRESILGIPSRISTVPEPMPASAGTAASVADRATLVDDTEPIPGEVDRAEAPPETTAESVADDIPSEHRPGSPLRSTMKSRSD